MAFEMVQPTNEQRAAVGSTTCELEWWRSTLGGARYRILCDTDRPAELSRFKLLTGPRGVELVESVEDWGQRPWEDQRPMEGDTVSLTPGRTWTYEGTISLGPVPWVGPAATVRMTTHVDAPMSRAASSREGSKL